MGVAMNNVLGFNASLSGLINSWTMLETSLGAIARLKNFEGVTECEDLPGEVGEPLEEWPKGGEITFEDVTASLR
jgi:hypothetical protein